ncbi:IS91 family transposase [Aurantimonas sp. A2-1-M11]|uniref:IS91 family transposase n=1 Tax=Aurantimonas sp. A2-1-M11 TaxID=3113712 RepID=UPI002F94CE42
MAPLIELADIFHDHGPAFRASRTGHLSLAELKVMSAIEHCRTAALGGHVEGCDDCGHLRIAYNSCRNRHCPRCQGAAARDWLAARQADLLPVGYFHVVFTLPAEIAAVAFQNKKVVYDLLFRTAVETITRIAANPKYLGASIGLTAVLHTWGSAMTHHPHVHMIVPGGGLSPDGTRWIASRPAFLLPVRVLGALFRRLFLEGLLALHGAGKLAFHGSLAHLADPHGFARHLAPVRRKRWVVYAKPPFAGPQAVLAYLSRYTHRVAISSRRITTFDGSNGTFRVKDYRQDGAARHRTLTLEAGEFIRRFLLHVLPRGFHRIRHYGFLTGPNRRCRIERIRDLIGERKSEPISGAAPGHAEPEKPTPPAPQACPCCGGTMRRLLILPTMARARAPPFGARQTAGPSP